MPMMQHTPHHRESGFTMVVIAALFIAFAVIAAVAVERNTTVQQITRRDTTVEQLTRLSNAIIEFSVFNKTGTTLLYPCPASMNMLTTDPSGTFGKSITNCSSGLSTGVVATSDSTEVIIGMVPVLDLSQYGIGINDAFDPWNDRILYVVNRRLTLGASPTLPTDQNTYNPTLNAISGSTPPAPDFILISLGRDGAGGVKRDSNNGVVSIPCPGSNNRSINCDGNKTFLTGPTYISVSGNAAAMSASYFDDILTWYRQ